MPSSTTSPDRSDFGQRLRSSRQARGLSLQALAARADVSASFISQVETGKSQPSIATLFALANGLGVPIGDFFGEQAAGGNEADVAPAALGAHAPPNARPWRQSEYSNRISLVHPTHRARVWPLEGVRWERLAATPDGGVNFKQITYAPGSASSDGGELVSHTGHEYGFAISGEIEIVVGDLLTVLRPGESIDFVSDIPHLLRNVGTVDFVGVWIDHYPFH